MAKVLIFPNTNDCMVNLLNTSYIYQNVNVKHIMQSQMYTNHLNNDLDIHEVEIRVKSTNEEIDFLYLFWLSGHKAKRSRFFLSQDQKKFQTKFSDYTILTINLTQKEYISFIHNFGRIVFDDTSKQFADKVISHTKKSFSVHIANIPFYMCERSHAFQKEFQSAYPHYTYISISFNIRFVSKSIVKQTLYLQSLKYIVPSQLE